MGFNTVRVHTECIVYSYTPQPLIRLCSPPPPQPHKASTDALAWRSNHSLLLTGLRDTPSNLTSLRSVKTGKREKYCEFPAPDLYNTFLGECSRHFVLAFLVSVLSIDTLSSWTYYLWTTSDTGKSQKSDRIEFCIAAGRRTKLFLLNAALEI